MEFSLDELVSQLKDEIFEEPVADGNKSEETADQEEIDIESYFVINKSKFQPVVIQNRDTITSSESKWISVKDQLKSQTQKEESQENKKLPLIVLRKDKIDIINNAIIPSQLNDSEHQNSIRQFIGTLHAKTTAQTKPQSNIFGIKNVPKLNTPKLVPIKVRVTKNEATTVNDANKNSELELQVKLLKDLLDDALCKNTIENPKCENTGKYIEKQPKLIETQPYVIENQPEAMETHNEIKQPNLTETHLKTTEPQPRMSKKVPINAEIQQNMTEKLKDELLKDFFDTSLSNKPTGSSWKQETTKNINESSETSANVPEKQPLVIETQPKIIENPLKMSERGKSYFYEVTEKQPKVIEIEPIIKENPFKYAENETKCYYYEVNGNQLKLIEKGLKITEALPKIDKLEDYDSLHLNKPTSSVPKRKITANSDEISYNSDIIPEKQPKMTEIQPKITEGPPKITENLKVKLLDDLLEPRQKITENCVVTFRNTDLEKQQKITEMLAGANMVDENNQRPPMIKLKAGNLKKIDYNQLQNMTEININKYLANAAPRIAETQVKIDPKTVPESSISAPNVVQSSVTEKPNLPAKQPQIILRSPIKSNPNDKSTANTPSINIISNEVIRHRTFGNTNTRASASGAAFNDKNSTKLDERIKRTKFNPDRIVERAECVNDARMNVTGSFEHMISTAEVILEDEIKMVDLNYDPFLTGEVQEVNALQDMDIKDPLYIEEEEKEIGQKQQRIEENVLRTKPNRKARPSTSENSTKPPNTGPKYCKICKKLYFTEESLRNHKNIGFKCCGKQFCTQKAFEEHKLLDHSVKRGNKNQNTKTDEKFKKQNHAERRNKVKTTEVIAEATETVTQEEFTHDKQIENTRIEKQNIKHNPNSTSTLKQIEETRRKQDYKPPKSSYFRQNAQCEICQMIFPSKVSLYLHINTTHDTGFHNVKSNWYLIQKSALFECEHCKLNISQYSPAHYEKCKQNITPNKGTECSYCNKKITVADVNHEFLHNFGYNPKTIPINRTKLNIVSECPICRYHYIFEKSNLLIHVKACKGTPLPKYECCGFVFNKNHYMVHSNNHTKDNILLTYDLLITSTDEFISEDEGSLKTIDELNQLHTADGKIIYKYGDKYRVVDLNDFISLETGRYQCSCCNYKAVSHEKLKQHEVKNLLNSCKRTLSSGKATTSGQIPLPKIAMKSDVPSAASLTCKLCRYVAGRKVELKYHMTFTCPARKIIVKKAQTTQKVSVRDTLKSFIPKQSGERSKQELAKR